MDSSEGEQTQSDLSESVENSNLWNTTQQRKLYYRELLDKIEDLEVCEDLGAKTAQELGTIIKAVNDIEDAHNIKTRFMYSQEVLLDSMVLRGASDLLVKCIEHVDANVFSYEPSEYAEKIMSFCKGDEDNFESDHLLKLLEYAQNIIPETAQYNNVYGAYDLNVLPQPKQKKERQKPSKEQAVRKEPQKVKNLEPEEQGIDEIVKTLLDVLTECYEQNNRQPIKYYDYVVDTSSFSKTVENIFYCSFLIRDGRASIKIDKGQPYIKPITKRQLKDYQEGNGTNSQMISVISMPQWEMIKKEGYVQRYQQRAK